MTEFSKTYLTEKAVTERLNALMFSKMKLGTYTGDAAATKAITGVGFQPKLLVIWNQVTNKALCVKSNQDTTKTFCIAHGGTNYYVDDVIVSLDADGFTVGDGTGSANMTNEAAAYAYAAFS